MKRKLTTLLAVALVLSGCEEDTTDMPFIIDDLSVELSEDEALRALKEAFMTGTPSTEILRDHKDTKTTCAVRPGQIVCRGPSVKRGLLQLRWIVTFDLDEDHKVAGHKVRMGRTGP